MDPEETEETKGLLVKLALKERLDLKVNVDLPVFLELEENPE